MAKFIGVDVSFWKDFPDWSKVSGIDFAIMGVTERNGIDASFYHNYDGCKSNGIKVGAYKYSYARNGEESRAEAEKVVRVLDGRNLDFPIFLDLEWDVQSYYSSSKIMEIITEFKKVVTDAGYMFGIYCNKHWYESVIPDEAKNEQFWIASIPYNDNGEIVESLKPAYSNVVGWQYSWNGSVPGIAGFVDMDVFYTDYSDASGEKNDEPIEVVPTVHLPLLSIGSTGNFVNLLQSMLNSYNDEDEGIVVDGIFGDITREAVTVFQIENGLDPDGIVGPVTWSRLFEKTNHIESLDQLAWEVICGFWGNQPEREKRFKEAGYSNYDKIQQKVNELL